ncbi:heterokaryon incompatibility protein domain-containing protein [Trichoderma chlorosporum]
MNNKTTDNAICPFCQNHTPNDKQSWMSQGNQHDASLLKEAMRNHCPLCTLIYRGLNALKPRVIAGNAKLQILIRSDYICLAWTDWKDEFSYQQPAYGMPNSHWALYYYAQPKLPSPWPTFKVAVPYSTQFDDPMVFSRLQTWIDNCCEKHTHSICQSPSEQVLPTRVIDLGSGKRPEPKLVEPIAGTKAKYIALSHCWGLGRSCITEKHTLLQRKTKIDIEQMPKTFQDAILVTWKVGVRYIWIDSLCIIQDDEDDWRKESVKMCDVYQNAFVTLSAASGSGDEVGFLNARPETFCGKQLEVQFNDSSLSYLVVQEKAKHFREADRGVKPHVGDPLETRAWTLQEDLLSRRIISFGAAEVSWECAEGLTCECKEIDDDWSSYDDGYSKLFSVKMTRSDIHRRWLAVCVQYSRRKLTKMSDKLPAMAGLATKFQEFLPDDKYVAGLWMQDLLRGLLWAYHHQWSPTEGRQRKAKMESIWRRLRAPTWSWASIDGAVTYRHLFEDPIGRREEGTAQWFAEIADPEALKVDTMGTITDGVLHLRGPMIKAVIDWKDDRRVSLDVNQYLAKGDSIQKWRGGDEIQMMNDVPLELVYQQDGTSSLIRSESRTEMEWPERVAVDCLVIGASDVEYTQYIRSQLRGFEEILNQTIYAIMLGPSAAKPGTYERLGYLSVFSPEKEHMRWVPNVPISDVFII